MDPSPPTNTARLTEREMLDRIVAAQQTQNRNHAERLALAVEFLHRCEEDREKKNGDTPPHFILTPLQEATAEIGPLLGIAEVTVEIHIDHTTKLQTWFPTIWARCLQGRLDMARAQIVLDAANALANKADIPKLAALIEEYLTKYDDPAAPLRHADPHAVPTGGEVPRPPVQAEVEGGELRGGVQAATRQLSA